MVPKQHGLIELHYPTILLRLSSSNGNDSDNENAVNGAENVPGQASSWLKAQATANGRSQAAFLGANKLFPEAHQHELPRCLDRAAQLSEAAGEAVGGGGDSRRKGHQ